MPVYDFQCATCGPFAVMRSIAARDLPMCCPDCGASAARMITAPALALMASMQRSAHATNERAAHEPRHASGPAARHPSGCGCCSGSRIALAGASGSAQPGALKNPSGGRRPWMISH
ncbi:FmdB family zinc ribbon protein [Paraburkholderia rhizosphaerae]|uniref:Putative FmdB family regulatory protein n=1 Tax=Paraburkholderia rhizosphaerae TaxID=480658 RepID=A0A4R8M111_9BURK|nr:zinc ribbon domain-containing protein [Paraburkholderia rhizosphaerae]TDY54966.1 putative FmdB family regulatory protein [Paraburkholderia rhizosphaerae]